MKLCLGTTIKLICLCARKGISNVRVGNKLFPDYESYLMINIPGDQL